MRPKQIATQQLAMILSELPEWHLSDDGLSLKQTLKFQNFRQAFAFMTEIAMVAETLDHHPDWSNSYHKVVISLTTHDVGGITDLDIKLAAAISRSANLYGARYEQ